MRLRLSTLLALTAALGLLVLLPGMAAGASALGEYQVKAAFVYNFSKYVEWPAESFESNSTPIVVTVLGNVPSPGAFEAIRGKTVKARKVELRTVRRLEDVQETHVLFVCASEKEHLGRILEFCRNRNVLSISDIEHFDQAGGAISFVTVDQKVRFHINLGAARRSGLRISSQLLKLARNVIE